MILLYNGLVTCITEIITETVAGALAETITTMKDAEIVAGVEVEVLVEEVVEVVEEVEEISN